MRYKKGFLKHLRNTAPAETSISISFEIVNPNKRMPNTVYLDSELSTKLNLLFAFRFKVAPRGEWSISILGTGAKDFRQGYETFCYDLMGCKTFKKDGEQHYFALRKSMFSYYSTSKIKGISILDVVESKH